MDLTVRGKSGLMEIRRDVKFPEAAKPNCAACDKPELDASSIDAVTLYAFCKNQQTFNQWSGHRLGMRMEAVTSCLDELCRQGRIRNRERAFRRVWIIDRAVNELENAKIATTPAT